MKIQVYRGSDATVLLPLNSSTFTNKLMGEHSLVFSVVNHVALDIIVGDTLIYHGQQMTINKTPKWTRNHLYEYEIRFEGMRHSLARWLLIDEGALTFSYFGSLEEYMFMFLERLNQVDSGWTIDIEEGLDPVAVSFDEVDCYSALNDIAEAFSCEWDVVGKTISIKKTIGRATTLSFSYGMGNGLYDLSRQIVDNSSIVTRAYATGGSQNLPVSYGKQKFTLDGFVDDTEAIALYGVREGVISDETIFPKRPGSATGVSQINEATFVLEDTSIDFDLEGQRIDGTEAKIVFRTGSLNGQEFKILSYNHDRKEIRYEANKDSNGGLLPSGFIVAEVGDEYTIVGIRMPESYVTAAIAELTGKRLEYLNANKSPRLLYGLNIDVLHLKRLNTEPQAGDIVRVVDAENGIDEDVRVTSVSYPGCFPELLVAGMQFNAEIGNEVTYTRIQKVEKDIKDTKEVVKQVSRESWENDRRNLIALQEFMGKVFDPDGNLQEPIIKAIVGFFGTESMLYDLEAVTYVVNEGGDQNAFSITSGQLLHKVYEIDGLGYIWDLTGLSVTGLDPLKSYFLSARCSRTALTGEWILSETQMPTEGELGYWHFNLGVLSSVIEGSRSLQSTMGYTMISGGEIITDSITAYRINVQKLFAQEVTATNLTVSGNSKIGPFSIDEEGLYYVTGGTVYQGRTRVNRNGITWNSLSGLGNEANLNIGQSDSILSISRRGTHVQSTGAKIDMEDDSKTALDIVNGQISVNGLIGLTVKIPFLEDPTTTKYLNITKGILTEITTS